MDDVGETLARVLERTGDYRILRRVPPSKPSAMTDEDRATAGLAIGIVLDTETTGLGPEDEIIELGMVRFAYDPTQFRIMHVVNEFTALRQPSRPIPPGVVRLTGISDHDVAGRTIDDEAVVRFVADASIVIAHNAGFDRLVVERAWPWFASLPWACSLTQIDWRAEGFEGRKLGHLLAERRSYHDGHRALDDCVALLHLLELPLTLGATGFGLMMHEAAQVAVRVWATASPFERKALLKVRGYRWASGEGRTPRAWWRDVPEALVEAEVAYLREHVYGDPGAQPLLRRVTSLDRFSTRADAPCL